LTHTHQTIATSETLRALEQLDSCTVSNVIELFNLRTRNEGFVHSSVRCIFPQLPPRVGYAATARIRTSATPIAGRCYYDRPEWWSYVLSIPEPRFIVAQDVDHIPGLGALFGEIHANISKALGCTAYITNGAVRDLPGIQAVGFQVFASAISVSHAYAHVVEFGEAVEIGGLRIKPGDLLHGDQHGIVSVPVSIAAEIPTLAQEVLKAEAELIEFCRSPEFSFERLTEKMRRVSGEEWHQRPVHNDSPARSKHFKP
jgi:regulator of RNase E activity RraA